MRWEGRRTGPRMCSELELPISQDCPWNKGQLIGQKRPLKPKDVWAIRVRLELSGSRRDVALFDLAIDSKLRACDLVRLKIQDVYVGSRARERATVIQKKTGRPVQFEISVQTRAALEALLESTDKSCGDYLFPGRFQAKDHLSIRQYAAGSPVGGTRRPGHRYIWHPFDTSDKSGPNLSEDRQSSRRPTPARP